MIEKHIAIYILTACIVVNGVYSIDFAEEFYIVEVEIDQRTETVTFVDLEKRTGGAGFRQRVGNYQIQLITEKMYYENEFQTGHLTIVENIEPCTSESDECVPSVIRLNKTHEVVYIPSTVGERYIRILKDNELKLEIDLDNVPREYIELACDNCDSLDYKIFWIPISVLILISIIAMLIHMIKRKPPQQNKNQYYQQNARQNY